jgi:hypothetical protein
MREPGWDSKVIARIATEKYFSWEWMFKDHKWPERGRKMMPAAHRRIKEKYGSVAAFAAKHGVDCG